MFCCYSNVLVVIIVIIMLKDNWFIVKVQLLPNLVKFAINVGYFQLETIKSNTIIGNQSSQRKDT